MSEETKQRNHIEELVHYLIINELVNSFEREGFQVLADHVGGLRAKPTPVGDFIPDIEARKGEELRLIEVETKTTLESCRAHDQLAGLAAVQQAKAYLAIPFDCISKARKMREDLDLDFAILPCFPFLRFVGMPR